MKPAVIHELFARLRQALPEPRTELQYVNAYTLLVAVVLSAQATDVSVNKAMAPVFTKIKTPQAMLKLGEDKLREAIKTIGFHNTKARNVIKLSQMLVDDYNGAVPDTRNGLEGLPGVGRKTANVVMNNIYGAPMLGIDTHVFRVANRTGLARAPNVTVMEDKLMKVVPAEFMRHAHNWLLLHGRYVCKARVPECPRCILKDICEYRPKTIEVHGKYVVPT